MSYREVYLFKCDNPGCKVEKEVDSANADQEVGPEDWITIAETTMKNDRYYGRKYPVTEYRHLHSGTCVVAYFKARDKAKAEKKKAAEEKKKAAAAKRAANKTTAKSTAKKTTGRKTTARKSTRRKSTRRR